MSGRGSHESVFSILTDVRRNFQHFRKNGQNFKFKKGPKKRGLINSKIWKKNPKKLRSYRQPNLERDRKKVSSYKQPNLKKYEKSDVL